MATESKPDTNNCLVVVISRIIKKIMILLTGIFNFLKKDTISISIYNCLFNAVTFFKDQYRYVYTIFIALLLVIQFSHLVGVIFVQSDNYGITYSRDVDAGDAIAGVKRTKWYNDNGSLYGPVYYRLAHSIYKLSPCSIESGSEEEKNEEKIHFSLLLISLISFFMVSYLLASLFIKEIRFRLLATLLISSTFLNNDTWVGYSIIHAHPDMLLSLFTGLFCYFIYLSLLNPEKESFWYCAGIMGGVALSTKLSFFLFLPGLIFFKIPPLNIKNVKKIIYFYLIIAVSYFLVGFPQNFKIWNDINFFRSGSLPTGAPTWESFMASWYCLFAQLWLTFLILIVLFIVFGKKLIPSVQKNYNSISKRMWVIVCLPFLIFLTKRFINEFHHYTLPFAVAFLTVISIWMIGIKLDWLIRLKKVFDKECIKVLASVILIILVQISYGLIPQQVEGKSENALYNRKEAKIVYKKIKEFVRENKLILIDPYVPSTLEDFKMYRHSWYHNFSDLEDGKTEVLVLTSNYYNRYLVEQPSEYIKTRKVWKSVRDFYKTFSGKKQVIDPFGQEWIKSYEDKYFEIWEKQ